MHAYKAIDYNQKIAFRTNLETLESHEENLYEDFLVFSDSPKGIISSCFKYHSCTDLLDDVVTKNKNLL